MPKNLMALIQDLEEAERIVKAIDHLLYVTYPLVKDRRMLLKILTETKRAIVICINTILKYEYINKRIELTKDPKLNFKLFTDKCSIDYGINENEIKLILDLFEVVEKHKESSFEFLKEGKVVILSENMNQINLTIEKTKEFLILSKNILKKTRDVIILK